MNYRLDKYGNEISILGFGCMRFQQKLGRIDLAEAEKEILLAIEQGVNYFDTAYIYPGSEAVLGQVLEKNREDNVSWKQKVLFWMMQKKRVLSCCGILLAQNAFRRR